MEGDWDWTGDGGAGGFLAAGSGDPETDREEDTLLTDWGLGEAALDGKGKQRTQHWEEARKRGQKLAFLSPKSWGHSCPFSTTVLMMDYTRNSSFLAPRSLLCISIKYFSGVGDGLSGYEHWLFSERTRVRFPALTQLTTNRNYLFRGSDTRFRPCDTAHWQHTNIYGSNTHLHKIKRKRLFHLRLDTRSEEPSKVLRHWCHKKLGSKWEIRTVPKVW